MARALADTGARILILERGDVVPVEEAELEPAAPSGKTCATGRRELWLDANGREFPPLHALQRRRQHEVLGQRALPAAPRGFQAIEHAGGVSPAWPIDYETLAPYYDRGRTALPGARRRRRRPDGAAARCRTRIRRCRTPPEMAEIVAEAPRHGPAPLAAAAGTDSTRAKPAAVSLCNTCNSFPCRIGAKSDAEICGVRPATAARQRHALDQCVCRAG